MAGALNSGRHGYQYIKRVFKHKRVYKRQRFPRLFKTQMCVFKKLCKLWDIQYLSPALVCVRLALPNHEFVSASLELMFFTVSVEISWFWNFRCRSNTFLFKKNHGSLEYWARYFLCQICSASCTEVCVQNTNTVNLIAFVERREEQIAIASRLVRARVACAISYSHGCWIICREQGQCNSCLRCLLFEIGLRKHSMKTP